MGEITLRKALEDYKTIYMAYRNFAERTREEYRNDLEGFISFADQSGVVRTGEMGLPVVERFVAGLEHEGMSSLTRKRKVVAIRSFLVFLYQDGYIDSNIAKKVVVPFIDTTTPHVLTAKECDRLRQACAGSPRDLAIIELLLQTGIRLSELVRLTLDDVQYSENTVANSLRILGRRGRKDRIIPINEKTSMALRQYLDVRGGAGVNILFLNRFGGTLGERGVQKMLEKQLKKAIIRSASVHTLRHTFGACSIARGMSTKAVQEAMGNRDVRSTSPYVSLAHELAEKYQVTCAVGVR